MRILLKLGTIAALLSGIVVSGCSANRFHDPSRTAYSTERGSRQQIAPAFAPPAGLLPYSNDRARAARAAAPAGSLPALDEEVWVIVKHDGASQREGSNSQRMELDRDVVGSFDMEKPLGDDFIPTCGTFICRTPPERDGRIRHVPLPLKHTEVRSTINAYIASVDVTQQFHNPYSSKIEAVYAFPLPENAAINGFVMTIGERRIRGIIREREEAQHIYNEAKSQGYVASLLTQDRPNIFTHHVANIEPLKQVDVNITYFHTLSYDDGWYEFVFPMVVGPRFNPPGSYDGIGAAERNDRGASGQSTEIQYLAPHERSGHDIGLTVDIMPGTPIEEVACRIHKVDINNEFSEHMRVTLKPSDAIPNKDFVLRYRVAGETVKSALLVHRDSSAAEEGHFTFMLIPPQQSRAPVQRERRPLEMIFVLDCSGSMNGEPIKQVKSAVDHALKHLQPNDTFQIIQFANTASQFGRAPLPATPENIRRGRDYVKRLHGDGGTMMIEGIKAALDFPHDPSRMRIVTFLTDGYIGNESEIFAAIHDRVGESRIFSFGVGSSPNRFLMDRMAKIGRGAVAYLSLKDKGDDVMDAFLARVSQPVLSDIEVDFGDMRVSDVVPARVPDLFVGRPVVITGRFTGEPPTAIRVTARADASSGQDWRGDWSGGAVVQTVQARFPVDLAAAQAGPALAAVWARMHIAELMDRATWDRSNIELPQMVKELALQHSLMSAYTSFIAVDSSQPTAGDHGTTVSVAVPVPEGVKYETTVKDRGN